MARNDFLLKFLKVICVLSLKPELCKQKILTFWICLFDDIVYFVDFIL